MYLGRIIGITITDASSYVARSLFYDELYNNVYPTTDKKAFAMGHARPHYAQDAEKVENLASNLGYDVVCYVDNDPVDCKHTLSEPSSDYQSRHIITFSDHGYPQGWSHSLSSSSTPWLDLPFMISKACSPNNLWAGKGTTFGPTLIRKGAIGVSLGTGLTPALPGVCTNNVGKKCFVESTCTSVDNTSKCISKGLPPSKSYDFITENNQISLGELYNKLSQDSWMNSQNSFIYYYKHLYLGDPTLVPRWT